MANVVEVRDARKEYKLGRTVVEALRGVSLDVAAGEFVVIAGPSGSGKSTLLNLIGCLDRASSGSVKVAGADVDGLGEADLDRMRSRSIGFVFQSFNLIPVLSVLENIELPLLLRKDLEPRERRERARRFMRAVGLERQAIQRPAELSGGQRQRVAVARALSGGPDIVLADEPTANLDSASGLEIIELMHRINREEGRTFIFSSHDPKVIQRADRVIHLEDGLFSHEERLCG